EVDAHDQRVAEEDGEADEPGAHEQEHPTAPPPGGTALRPCPIERREVRGRSRPGLRYRRHALSHGDAANAPGVVVKRASGLTARRRLARAVRSCPCPPSA